MKFTFPSVFIEIVGKWRDMNHDFWLRCQLSKVFHCQKFGLCKWISIKSFLLPTSEQPASEPVFPSATHTVSKDKVSRIQNWLCVICIESGTQLTFVWFMSFEWFPYRRHFEHTNWGLCSSGTNVWLMINGRLINSCDSLSKTTRGQMCRTIGHISLTPLKKKCT